jgi:hypothetical protein
VSSEVLRAHDVALHPLLETLAVAADRVPSLVEGVVPVVVAVSVDGWEPWGTTEIAPTATDGSTTWNGRGWNSSTTSSTVTTVLFAESTASFWMPTIPQIATFPLRSAC